MSKPIRLHDLAKLRRRNLPTWLISIARKYGPNSHIKLPKSRIVFLGDYSDVNTVYTDSKKFQRGALNFAMGRVLGTNLITTEGAEWRPHRKPFNGPFHKERMQGYNQTVLDTVEAELPKWVVADDLKPLIYDFTTRVILAVTFGSDANWHPSLLKDVQELFTAIPYILAASIIPDAVAGKIFAQEKRTLRNLRPQVLAMLAAAIDQAKESNDGLIPELYSLFASMSPEVMQFFTDDTLALIFGGYDTTGTALSMLLFTIAHSHNLQEQLRHESQDQSLWGNLDKLPLLKQLSRISMLLYPPAIINSRKPLGDMLLLSGTTLRESDLILLSPMLSAWHHLQQRGIYHMPLAHELMDDTDFVAHMPNLDPWFGGGQHFCVGAPLVEREIATLIPRVLSQYQLSTSQQEWSIMLGSVQELTHLKLQFTKL